MGEGSRTGSRGSGSGSRPGSKQGSESVGEAGEMAAGHAAPPPEVKPRQVASPHAATLLADTIHAATPRVVMPRHATRTFTRWAGATIISAITMSITPTHASQVRTYRWSHPDVKPLDRIAGKSVDLSSPDERGGHSLVAINSTILITFGGHYCRWEPGGPHRPFRDYETALLDDPKVACWRVHIFIKIYICNKIYNIYIYIYLEKQRRSNLCKVLFVWSSRFLPAGNF